MSSINPSKRGTPEPNKVYDNPVLNEPKALNAERLTVRANALKRWEPLD